MSVQINTLTTLIVGCGNIGNRIALELKKSGHQVIGLRRNIDFLIYGIESIGADICDISTLPKIEDEIDHFIFCPSAKSKDADKYHTLYVQGLKNALASLSSPPKRIWIISSTGVYSETQGEWIDEQTPIKPLSDKQKHLAEAENIASQHAATTVLRLSGLYGLHQRHLFKWIEQGHCPLPASHWSNRIHNNDAAHCIVQLIQNNIETPLVLISDGKPLRMQVLLEALSKRLKQPPPSFSTDSSNINKRITNKKLRALLPKFSFKDALDVYQKNTDTYTALKALTPFQQNVLWHTYKIPFGKVISYGDMAKWVGSTGASRAVGQALSINPCTPEIPCHRVIKSDRSLHGFSSSTDNHALKTKFQQLLDEGIVMNQSKQSISAYTVHPQHLFNPTFVD